MTRPVFAGAGLTTVVLLALSSCSQAADDAGARQGGTSSAPSGTAVTSGPNSSSRSGSPSDDNSHGKVNRPPNPLAPASVVPVKRPGGPTSRIDAAPVKFDKPLIYRDGVSVSVTRIAQGRTKASGPGELDGPLTTMTLVLTNGSRHDIQLDNVVITSAYGRPARLAHPVYSAAERDFAGTLRPGGKTRAVYAFSIPRSALNDVSVYVDIDARHAVGRFTGSTT